MEPDEEDHKTDEGTVGDAHGRNIQNVVSISSSEGDPDGCDQEGSGEHFFPVHPPLCRCIFIEGGQREGNDGKGDAELHNGPRFEENFRHIEIVGYSIDHRISKDDEPEGKDHGKREEEGEDDRFHFHAHIGLDIPVSCT